MMTTAIPLTLNLLVLIGAYELAAGLAGLRGGLNWTAMLEEFERSPALTFITGFVAFAIGAAMMLGHNHWTDPLAIIVSFIALVVVAEGLLVMIAPRPLLAFARRMVGSQKKISVIAIAFGLVLILLGLLGRADSTPALVLS